MNTNPVARHDRPSPSRRPVRRLAAAVAITPLLVLGACTGEAPITATTAAPPATTAPGSTGGPTSPTTSSTTPVPTSSPTTLKTKGSIKDDVLGHVITPTKVIVDLPWPEDHPVAEEHFELVGVEVKVQAGTRYSAAVTPDMFTLTSSAPGAVPATNEFKGALGKELGTVKRGQTASGWLIFKVDKGTASTLTLNFNRPAYDVKTTDKSIKAKTFTLKLR